MPRACNFTIMGIRPVYVNGKLKNLRVLFQFNSGQCSRFKPPENNRKTLIFWCFQGI